MSTNLQRALDVTDGSTLILSNGSKTGYEQPDDIVVLMDVLKNYTLAPRFEKYGWFSRWSHKESKNSPWFGKPLFFGNFLNLSHVFNIVVEDVQIANQLKNTILQNLSSDDYRKNADHMYQGYCVLQHKEFDDEFRLVKPALYERIKCGCRVGLSPWEQQCFDYNFVGARTSIDYML